MDILTLLDNAGGIAIITGIFTTYYVGYKLLLPLFQNAECVREYNVEKKIIESGKYHREKQQLYSDEDGHLLLFGDIILNKAVNDKTPVIRDIKVGINAVDDEIFKPIRQTFGIKPQPNGKGVITNGITAAANWLQTAVLDTKNFLGIQ